MNPFVVIALVAAVVAAAIMFLRAGSLQTALEQTTSRVTDLEKRLTESQEALTGAREDVKRKGAALEEAREKVQKAKKKETRELRLLDKPAAATSAPSEAEAKMAEQRYLAAVENAERRAAAAEKTLANQVEAIRAETRVTFEAELGELRRRAERAEQLARKRDEEPVQVKREEPRTEVVGARMDLKTLAPEVLTELARFYRRAQNAEKLSVVTEKQLEVAQDKLEELNRRYFAVCRELALVAINKDKPQEQSDAEAAKVAMDLVRASEEASRRRASLKGPAQRPPRPNDGAPREAKDGNGSGDRDGRPQRLHSRPRRPRRDMPHRASEGDATKPDVPKGPEAAPRVADAAPSEPAPPPASGTPPPTTTQG